MKKFSMWFVTILLIVSMIFGIVGCKEPPVQIEPPVLDNPNVDVNPDDSLPQTGNTVEDTTPPGNVTDLVVLNKDSSVLLTWTDATDNDILGYEVSWDKEAPINRAISLPENSMMVAIKSQGCYISNLKNGIEYEFTVKTVDFSGNKSSGLKVKITPTIIEKTPLQIRLDQNITERTDQDILITVTATTENSSSIDKIYYREGTWLKYEDVSIGTDITTNKTITATKNGTYTVLVTDTADRKELQWITISNIYQKDTTAPSNVTDFMVTNKDSSVLLTWTDVTDSDIFGYEITWDQSSLINRSFFMAENSIMVAPKIQGCYISNLNNGQEYKFIIKSVDVSGNKSIGISKLITPNIIEKSPLQIVLKPSTTELTENDISISVEVKTDSSSQIQKISYMDGFYSKIDEVLAGTDITKNKVFVANKNTTYTVVVTDTAGRRELQWITISNLIKPLTLTLEFVDFDKKVIKEPIEFEFTAGDTLAKITENISGDIYSDEFYSFIVDDIEYELCDVLIVDENNETLPSYAFENKLNDPIYTSLTFKYVYEPYVTFPITFNLNGGSIYGDYSDVTIQDFTYWREFSDYIVKPKKDGFVFIGWTKTLNKDDFIESSDTTITVYARWEERAICKLTIKGNLGSLVTNNFENLSLPLTYEFTTGENIRNILNKNHVLGVERYIEVDEKKYELTAYLINDEKYSVDNYIDYPNFDSYPVIYFDTNVDLYKDTNLELIYSPCPFITFDLNGGNINGDTSIQKQYIGANLNFDFFIDEPKKDGFVFVGWTSSKNGNEFITYTNKDTTVYAKWEEGYTVTLRSDSNYFLDIRGNESWSDVDLIFTENDTVSDISRLLKEQHLLYILQEICEYNSYHDYDCDCRKFDFNGFINDEGELLPDNEILTPNLNISLSYLPRNPRICFEGNGGEFYLNDDGVNCTRMESYLNSKEEKIDAKINYTPYRDGYIFEGWTLNPDGEDFVEYTDRDITVFAKWKEIEKYSLIINCEADGYIYDRANSENYSFGSKFEFTPGITLEDYFSINNLGIIINDQNIEIKSYKIYDAEYLNKSEIYLNDDTTLELICGKKPLIKFYTNDGTSDILFNEIYVSTNQEFTELISTPYREGFVFEGWTKTPEGDDFITQTDKDISVYAKWRSYIPYYYSDDNSQVTFIFRPVDFSFVPSTDFNVQLMSNITTWDVSSNQGIMEKDSNGNYLITFDYQEISDALYRYDGFMFRVIEEDFWFSPRHFYHEINEKPDGYGGYHFVIELPSPSITIDLNGGSINGDISNIYIDQLDNDLFNFSISNALFNLGIDLSQLSNGEYKFAGWTFTKDGTDFVDLKYNSLPYGNFTFYAKWYEAKECTVTLVSNYSNIYDKNSDSFRSELYLGFESGQSLNEIFIYNGYSLYECFTSYKTEDKVYTFTGKFMDNEGNIYDESQILIEDIILYPVFETGYTAVKLNTNGGYFTDFDDVEINTLFMYIEHFNVHIKRDNYYFMGWTTTQDGDEFITIQDEFVYESLGVSTLYAKWQDVSDVITDGTWYYYDIPTDAINVIFNAGDNQTSDITNIDVSEGSIYYAWNSELGKEDFQNNLRYEPEFKPESLPGRVWCYTNSTSIPNCFWWGCSESVDSQWPGKPMAKEGEAPVEEFSFILKSIEVVNAPEFKDAKYYAFCESWVPYNVWNNTTINKVYEFTNDSIVFDFGGEYYEHTTSLPATLSIQILNPVSEKDADFWVDDSKVGGGVLSVNIPIDCDGKTYVWKIYADKDYYSEFVEIPE